MPPAVEARVPNHWTAREFPSPFIFFYLFFKIYFIYLFLAVSGLSCGMWDLRCGTGSFVVACGFSLL